MVFQMFDDLARLHDEQDRLKWIGDRSKTQQIERFYTGRLRAWLEAEGLGPIEDLPTNAPVDLRVGGVDVEIKIARAQTRERTANRQGRREFYFALLWEPGRRRVLNGEIVIMVCVDPGGRLWPYVIPRENLGNRRTITISSSPVRYRGLWAPFLGAFDHLREAIHNNMRGGKDGR